MAGTEALLLCGVLGRGGDFPWRCQLAGVVQLLRRPSNACTLAGHFSFLGRVLVQVRSFILCRLSLEFGKMDVIENSRGDRLPLYVLKGLGRCCTFFLLCFVHEACKQRALLCV